MKEKWKDVLGYEGKYQVSDLGRIRTLTPRHGGTTLVLHPSHDKDGYLIIWLYKNGTKTFKRVHRLVAEAFIENKDKKPQVNHIDENKENNCVNNLEWVTCKENNNHGTRNARVSAAKRNTKCKKIIQMDFNGGVLKTWDSVNEVERQLGFDTAALSRCCRWIQKTSYGYRWEYA